MPPAEGVWQVSHEDGEQRGLGRGGRGLEGQGKLIQCGLRPARHGLEGARQGGGVTPAPWLPGLRPLIVICAPILWIFPVVAFFMLASMWLCESFSFQNTVFSS